MFRPSVVEFVNIQAIWLPQFTISIVILRSHSYKVTFLGDWMEMTSKLVQNFFFGFI